ncbi:MAG: cytochrome c [Chthoniobacteraceae bacterium]
MHFAGFIAFLIAATSAAAVRADEWKPNLPDRSQFEAGAYVYERNCIICHGPLGDGKGELSPTLMPKPRSFRSGIFKYSSTPAGKLPTNEDLARSIRGGLANTAMGMFTALRDDEVRAAVEYIKRFSRRWRDDANYAPPIEVPPLPDWWRDPTELARRAAAGRATFQTFCATCHGEHADGKGPAAAALKNEWGDPIAPADLRQRFPHTGATPRDVFRVLLTGINGTPMVSFATTLTDEQRWELAAQIDELRKSAN